MTQPTYEELRAALEDLAQVIGIIGAESEARTKLYELRKQKTTWVGPAENDLRFAINSALED